MGSWFSSPATRQMYSSPAPIQQRAMTPEERVAEAYRKNDSYYSGGKSRKRSRKHKRKTHRRRR